MKKIFGLTALSLLLAVGANAQTIYDAANFAGKDLNGTARFVGMGGAMGALGGDISTIGTNPAGIGIYRGNDIMTSFGFSTYGTESKFMGEKFISDKTRGSFDNIGFVFSSRIGNETPLRFVNFGFNYKRAKSFDRNMSMGGFIGDNSQTFQMAAQAVGINEAMWDDGNRFDNPDIGWLSAFGFDGYLIDPGVTTKDNGYPLLDENKQPILDDKGNPLYATYYGVAGNNPLSSFRSQEKGGIDQYDFNVSFNFNDRVYFGVTFGAYALNYNKYSFYDEDYGMSEGYNLQSWNKIKGAGYDLKLGLIMRPFEYSPLRVGIAVHTPTFYNLELSTSARLESDLYNPESDLVEAVDVDSYDRLDNTDMVRPFNLRTPWTVNASLGYTVGSNLALGAEYEFQDYASSRYYYPDNGDGMRFENSANKEMLKGVHTLRLGAEYKVIPQFAIRAGYNYVTSAFEKGAYKDLPLNSISTDTDFANARALNNYTLGIGYRGSILYADLAYKFTTYNADFYAFNSETLAKTEVNNTRSQVLFTLGVRF